MSPSPVPSANVQPPASQKTHQHHDSARKITYDNDETSRDHVSENEYAVVNENHYDALTPPYANVEDDDCHNYVTPVFSNDKNLVDDRHNYLTAVFSNDKNVMENDASQVGQQENPAFNRGESVQSDGSAAYIRMSDVPGGYSAGYVHMISETEAYQNVTEAEASNNSQPGNNEDGSYTNMGTTQSSGKF
jgi:hypothetical protein